MSDGYDPRPAHPGGPQDENPQTPPAGPPPEWADYGAPHGYVTSGAAGSSYPQPAGQWPAPGGPVRSNRLAAALAAFLIAVGVVLGAGVTYAWRHSVVTTSAGSGGGGSFGGGSSDNSGTGSSGSGSIDAAAIAQRVDPGVVDINTSLGSDNAQAAGTGIVLTSNGEILTNNHVIAGATRISVTDVGNGRTYSADVVGYDRSHDVAVLQLNGASGLATVSIGDSSRVQVGQAVVAVGNAGGAGGTPSYAGGSVTALDQSITATDESDGTSQQLTGLIETDANIVPGDSGGPLVDAQGRVIALDAAATSGYRFNESTGQGFAIPINEATQIAQQIEAGHTSGTVHVGPTAHLGVEVASGGDPSGDGSGSFGAQLASVVSGGPAEAAGLTAGDTITAVDGHSVTSVDALTSVLSGESPGASVQVQYVDQSGQQHTATVQLASGPPQ